MDKTLFNQLKHPFVWTTPADREEVLANANDPVWHRFLEEAELHFENIGGLRPAEFPVFCHKGDLDEVMAVAVLAYVRDEGRYWSWIAGWLRGLLDYYREAKPRWLENRIGIVNGKPSPFSKELPNPRQHFEGFTEGLAYWVEAGLTSVVLHLLDLLEAHAPQELSASEKSLVLEAVASYADRYAFHEEAFKYNNRGMWANSGILLAAVAHADPRTSRLLRFQAARRHEEFRSTFLDDGFHIEGAPDYHLMAADGLFTYLLTASHLDAGPQIFEGKTEPGIFQHYPSFVHIVRAYLNTVIPGPVLWQNARGISVSMPLRIRPSLVWAWKQTRDPEIGWFLRQQMEAVVSLCHSPLPVTKTALLGLGDYQPLLNFWLYRPVDSSRRPGRTCDILPDHGAVFSRSGWDPAASCVTARFGYEGTGKGHRDHAHVTLAVGGVEILKDPFPRVGPAGQDSSPFHNTVTLDNAEPAPVIGSLRASLSLPGADAFLVDNSGGQLPDRIFLHDPREETNCYFTNHPETPDFGFQRAILHLHNRCAIFLDRLVANRPRQIDWFFHSNLQPEGYNPSDVPRFDSYQIRQRTVSAPAWVLNVPLRGEIKTAGKADWGEIFLGEGQMTASCRFLSPDAPLQVEKGHWECKQNQTPNSNLAAGEKDWFLRFRTEATEAVVVWVFAWGDQKTPVRFERTGNLCKIFVEHLPRPLEWSVDFGNKNLTLQESSLPAE